jgi:hypothetical protein
MKRKAVNIADSMIDWLIRNARSSWDESQKMPPTYGRGSLGGTPVPPQPNLWGHSETEKAFITGREQIAATQYASRVRRQGRREPVSLGQTLRYMGLGILDVFTLRSKPRD